MCVPRTCYCDDTIHLALGSRGCIALVEHATKGKKHAEKVALRRYLHNIIIIIKCMYSRCRRDEIHVCFAYASLQCMPHM